MKPCRCENVQADVSAGAAAAVAAKPHSARVLSAQATCVIDSCASIATEASSVVRKQILTLHRLMTVSIVGLLLRLDQWRQSKNY
jgi:hypothetical protein